MRKLFIWFYCLPLEQSFLLVLLATAVFLLLRHRFGSTPWWKRVIPVLLLCWLAVILLGTLGHRTEG